MIVTATSKKNRNNYDKVVKLFTDTKFLKITVIKKLLRIREEHV